MSLTMIPFLIYFVFLVRRLPIFIFQLPLIKFPASRIISSWICIEEGNGQTLLTLFILGLFICTLVFHNLGVKFLFIEGTLVCTVL